MVLKVFEILVSALLVIVITMQARGSGASGVFGMQGSAFRTRRGVEKRLFQLTIALAAVFFVTSLLIAKFGI
ncbi:MAG: preprotein translocase subunit SecG [Chloroflexi bacterium]|nr:preprotein translocase subunit SecG [Chloroflexota bacterium]